MSLSIRLSLCSCDKGPFKCYVMQMGVGGVSHFLEKKHSEGVRYNVISITRGWVEVQFPGKKRYVTLEWPLNYSSSTTFKCCEPVSVKQLFALN